MKDEYISEAVAYAHKSFKWPLNKQGEKQSIPPGQLIPPGYAKHQKSASKHFLEGVKWHSNKIEKLLNTLRSQNMCSEVGDELIDEFLKTI